MKERKVVSRVFTKSKCIVSDEAMKIYDTCINILLGKNMRMVGILLVVHH